MLSLLKLRSYLRNSTYPMNKIVLDLIPENISVLGFFMSQSSAHVDFTIKQNNEFLQLSLQSSYFSPNELLVLNKLSMQNGTFIFKDTAPGYPYSHMYSNDDITGTIKDLVAEKEICYKVSYKKRIIEFTKAKLEISYSSELELLRKYYLEEVPELYIHLYFTLEILNYLSSTRNIKLNNEHVRMALLHDIGKPLYLLIKENRLYDPVLLNKFANRKKDTEISLEIISELEDINGDNYDLLINFLHDNYKDDLPSSLVKLSELLSSYYLLAISEELELALYLKALSVASVYKVDAKYLLKKYIKLLDIIIK